LSKLWEQSAELEKLRANPPPRLRSEMLDYCGKLDARAKAMRKDLESHQAYCAKIEAFASRIRMDFGHGSRQTYEANIHALAAAMRRDLKLPNPEENKVLTEVTPERNLAGMTEIAFLLQRLKRALEGVRKGDLARSLKVPLPRVSEWLSGRVMPSGETALRLLQWVEQRERKPNAPDSATNAVKGKATRRKVVYEKKPTSSHKQE
jgi:DNA-binding transcriptional regulator YiaG